MIFGLCYVISKYHNIFVSTTKQIKKKRKLVKFGELWLHREGKKKRKGKKRSNKKEKEKDKRKGIHKEKERRKRQNKLYSIKEEGSKGERASLDQKLFAEKTRDELPQHIMLSWNSKSF